MSHSPEHQQIHTKMVKQALKDVARQNQYPYQTGFKEFVDGNNPSCTQCFWETFYRLFPRSSSPSAMTAANSTSMKPKPRCMPMARSGDSGFQPRPMKALFQRNGARADIMASHPVRPVEVEVITKMLACGTPLMGSREFHCSNADCTHHQFVHQSCNGRGCPTCGKKATDLWIATMMARLPDTPCQHGTFTLPDTLWPLFETNRWLLDRSLQLPAVRCPDGIQSCAWRNTIGAASIERRRDSTNALRWLMQERSACIQEIRTKSNLTY